MRIFSISIMFAMDVFDENGIYLVLLDLTLLDFRTMLIVLMFETTGLHKHLQY